MSYHTGQVCLNGHGITANIGYGLGSPFCEQCGAKTITNCPHCKGIIRGYVVEGWGAKWEPAAHCFNCGAAYPWTAAKVTAVEELASAIEELTDHEREVLLELMPHLLQETPRTGPAGFKVAAIVGRLSAPAKAAFRGLLNDLVVEAGKTALGFK